MLDPSWSSMGASSSSAASSSTSTPTATESATPAPATATATDTRYTSPTHSPPGSDNNSNHHNMDSSMVSESSGSTSSWIEVEQTMTQATGQQAHNGDDNNINNTNITPDQPPSTAGSGSGSAAPSPIPSPYPSLSPPDEDTWSHDDLSLGDDEGLASSISSLSSLQATNPDTDRSITDEDLQPHSQQSTTASLGASALGVSSVTSSWHGSFHSLHDATNDHDSPPLSTTSSPISSTTSHSMASSPPLDITSSSFINVSTPTLASTLAASTLAATAMATSMAQPHVTSVPIEIPSPSLYPQSSQSDHSDSDDSHSTTSSGAILIATMCGLFLGLMASSWYFSRRSRKRGLETDTTIATLQRLLSEKDMELKRITELFQQYLATPIVVRLTER